MPVSEIRIPGSKYIANRVLLLSALTGGVSTIHNVPSNTDVDLLRTALQEVGAKTTVVSQHFSETTVLEVEGIYAFPTGRASYRKIDAGESGTLLRFSIGLACLLDGETEITASPRNMERPIEPLVKALRELGAAVMRDDNRQTITVKRGLNGGIAALNGNTSSQFISSLLIVSPYADSDVEIRVGLPIVSRSYIDITVREMQRFGVHVDRIRKKDHELFRVSAGQRYVFSEVSIPKDWSSTNCLVAASVILNKETRIEKTDPASNPSESAFVGILREMGCRVVFDSNRLVLQRSDELRGVDTDMCNSPDSVLTLIAVALFASGKTRIRNIGHLNFKESKRIEKVAKELAKIGASVTATSDSIEITGGKLLHGAATDSHGDHRLAMCLGLIGLKNKNMTIRGKESVRKSFPEFWKILRVMEKEELECLEIP